MIIFDEFTQATKILDNELGTDVLTLRSWILIAKYFKYLGHKPAQIRQNLIRFCYKNIPAFNEILMDWKITKAVEGSRKSDLRVGQSVSITKKEIETIKTIKDYKIEKILFVMLAVAKFFKKGDGDLYINAHLRDIFRLAKVRVSIDDRNQIIYNLNTNNYIQATLVGSFKILFEDKDGEEYIIIDDWDHIIEHYPIECIKCGNTIKYRSRQRNLCQKCYDNRRREQIKVNVRNYRRKTLT